MSVELNKRPLLVASCTPSWSPRAGTRLREGAGTVPTVGAAETGTRCTFGTRTYGQKFQSCDFQSASRQGKRAPSPHLPFRDLLKYGQNKDKIFHPSIPV